MRVRWFMIMFCVCLVKQPNVLATPKRSPPAANVQAYCIPPMEQLPIAPISMLPPEEHCNTTSVCRIRVGNARPTVSATTTREGQLHEAAYRGTARSQVPHMDVKHCLSAATIFGRRERGAQRRIPARTTGSRSELQPWRRTRLRGAQQAAGTE